MTSKKGNAGTMAATGACQRRLWVSASTVNDSYRNPYAQPTRFGVADKSVFTPATLWQGAVRLICLIFMADVIFGGVEFLRYPLVPIHSFHFRH